MAAMPVLITFIPMLMGTGGNCGSQSSTLIIRGLAVGEIEFRDILKVIFKESQDCGYCRTAPFCCKRDPDIYHVRTRHQTCPGAWPDYDRSCSYGEMHRVHPSADSQKTGPGSGDYGGSADHDNSGYMYNSCVF